MKAFSYIFSMGDPFIDIKSSLKHANTLIYVSPKVVEPYVLNVVSAYDPNHLSGVVRTLYDDKEIRFLIYSKKYLIRLD